ncbi:MAG TPA: S-layer homology domain-containing protein [Acidimicrobiia bacterium]|nr:S-layer homology domain-containing protein [Acidimicrobiia bacterium]
MNRYLIALFMLGVLVTTIVMPSPSASGDTTFSPGSIGVIGCSNTAEHVVGYWQASDVDLLAAELPGLGGGSLAEWQDPGSKYWAEFAAAEPPAGYEGIWIQICIRETENDGAMTATHQRWMESVVAEVRRRVGSVPLYVSPLNYYTGAEGCPLTGPSGQTVTVELADWASSNLDVWRGPDTGPLDADQLSDGCHLNQEGQHLVGEQLVEFFDDLDGDAPPTTGPPPSSPPQGDGFLDIAGSTFEGDIEWLVEEGITKGCNPPDNDLFCPGDWVTRGHMAAFLNRALQLPGGPAIAFVDDDNSVFESDIEHLAAAGITRGCNPPDNDMFCPDRPVTRGEMAAFLVRGLDLPDRVGADFVDDDDSEFESDIERLAAAGITLGCNPPDNDRFCPVDLVTRGEMAAFLHRAEKRLP